MANDGGSAFPTPFVMVHDDDQGKDYPQYATSGMTLRDWFATHAPEAETSWIERQSQLDKARNPHNEPHHKYPIRSLLELKVAWKWQYADAMLKRREAVEP